MPAAVAARRATSCSTGSSSGWSVASGAFSTAVRSLGVSTSTPPIRFSGAVSTVRMKASERSLWARRLASSWYSGLASKFSGIGPPGVPEMVNE